MTENIKRLIVLRDALFNAGCDLEWFIASAESDPDDHAGIAQRETRIAEIEREIAALLALPDVAAHEAEEARIRFVTYRLKNRLTTAEAMAHFGISTTTSGDR
jgi:hypothetical protein